MPPNNLQFYSSLDTEIQLSYLAIGLSSLCKIRTSPYWMHKRVKARHGLGVNRKLVDAWCALQWCKSNRLSKLSNMSHESKTGPLYRREYLLWVTAKGHSALIVDLPGHIVILKIGPVGELMAPLINRHTICYQNEHALSNPRWCSNTNQSFASSTW